jgi:hypothetical protein
MNRRRFLLSLAPALVAPAWAPRAWATTIPGCVDMFINE